ncbi:MAG: antitermination regulator [Leifsonia sp.]|jgi:GAF domain-containing protein|nr:antitermination regulator [Leifsonia sp.]
MMGKSARAGAARPASQARRPNGEDLYSPFVDFLPVTGVSISVIGETGRQSTICASDPTAARLEELQFDLGEGPHWTAMHTGQPALVEDVTEGEHPEWPIFGAAVLRIGVGALFAFPLPMGAVTIGVVDLYRSTPGPLKPGAVATARSLAGWVAGPAARYAIQSAGAEIPAEMQIAPELRREVHQATGMVLVQLDTNATDAFFRLRAHAYSSGQTLHDVAHQVVTRQLDFRDLKE